MNKAVPKSMNGKELSGEMIVSIAEKSIEAMNAGKVPDIESSWTYMCQNECRKVFDQSATQFQIKIDTFPLPDADIRFKYDRAKKIALDFFLHKCRDLNAEKMLNDLNHKLDELIRAKETINQRAL